MAFLAWAFNFLAFLATDFFLAFLAWAFNFLAKIFLNFLTFLATWCLTRVLTCSRAPLYLFSLCNFWWTIFSNLALAAMTLALMAAWIPSMTLAPFFSVLTLCL